MAKIFIGSQSYDKVYVDQLRQCFESFLTLSEEALELNRKLIKNDQIEFQADLEESFKALKAQLTEIISK